MNAKNPTKSAGTTSSREMVPLGRPPIIAGENAADYEALRAHYVAALKPQCDDRVGAEVRIIQTLEEERAAKDVGDDDLSAGDRLIEVEILPCAINVARHLGRGHPKERMRAVAARKHHQAVISEHGRGLVSANQSLDILVRERSGRR